MRIKKSVQHNKENYTTLGAFVKLTVQLTVKNSLGLHTRPAVELVKLLREYSSAVKFTHGKSSTDGDNIMGLLMLAAKRNSVITAEIEGEDALEVEKSLINAFEREFGE